MKNKVNEKLAKIFGFPEHTIRADIRMRPMHPPEVDLTYMIVDSSGMSKEIEGRFQLVEIKKNED
jgi:hypothetical protein